MIVRRFAYVLLAIGIALISHGVYERRRRFSETAADRRVDREASSVPPSVASSVIDTQMHQQVQRGFQSMFDGESPWFDRNVSLGNPLKGI
jgi:hypothetical protein